MTDGGRDADPTAAHRSITTSSGPSDDDSLALFNAQTTLKRIPADRAPGPETDPCVLSNALADAVAQQITKGSTNGMADLTDFTFDPTFQDPWPEGDFGDMFNPLGVLDNCESGRWVWLILDGDDFSWFTAEFS